MIRRLNEVTGKFQKRKIVIYKDPNSSVREIKNGIEAEVLDPGYMTLPQSLIRYVIDGKPTEEYVQKYKLSDKNIDIGLL